MEKDERLLLSALRHEKHAIDVYAVDNVFSVNHNDGGSFRDGIDINNNSIVRHAIMLETTTNLAEFNLSDSNITLQSTIMASNSSVDHLNVANSINELTTTDYNNSNDNYWALFALVLVLGTAAGNILVCLAIAWERRLQNVTNYFLMSLAITDLMVAILVMPFGILTLVKGE